MPIVNGLPTYGNWGGPGWSANHETPSGYHLKPDDLTVPGVDKLDELFKQHDIDYDKAQDIANPYERNKAIQAADENLLVSMLKLDRNDPSNFLDPVKGSEYLGKAIPAFTLKALEWDPDFFDMLGHKAVDAIDAIKGLFGRAEGYYTTGSSPLILDLDGDGVETTGVKAGTYFDHGDDGFVEQTGWVGQDDGLLVLDRNQNGLIESGKELFGNSTLLANGQKAANGFTTLAELD